MENVEKKKKPGTKYQAAEKTQNIGERYAQKKENNEQNFTNLETTSNTVAEKVEYNPKIHSVETKTNEEKIDRYRKRDKQKKMKRKRLEKENLYLENYNDLLLDHLSKEVHTTESPHLVFNYKWFKKIKHNVIMFKNPTEVMIDSKRRIHYEIDYFGKNVDYTQKGNTWILNVSNTKTNSMYLLVRLKDIIHIPKVQYHTAFGKMISKYDIDKDRGQCFVLLAMIHLDKKTQKSKLFFEEKDMKLMKRYLRNQITTTSKNYHFNTTGTIYGFGYGPKSNKNEYGHSICRFANSKFEN